MALFVLVPLCFARSTSWRFMTSTTRLRDMMLTCRIFSRTPYSFDITNQILSTTGRSFKGSGLVRFAEGLVYDAQNTFKRSVAVTDKRSCCPGCDDQRYNQSPLQSRKRLEKQRQLPFPHAHQLGVVGVRVSHMQHASRDPTPRADWVIPRCQERGLSARHTVAMLEYHERQIFTGPPENTRDHVMQASKALAAGEWKKATHFIHSIKICRI